KRISAPWSTRRVSGPAPTPFRSFSRPSAPDQPPNGLGNYNLPSSKLLIKVVLPSAIPSIITGMRLAAAYSFLMLVVSKMIGETAVSAT
ncbi:ABC transporter permease subunit, partial [Hyphomicrobiales bacterium BP6-180914]